MAQASSKLDTSVARAAFEQQLLAFSQQFHRTVILEDLPDFAAGTIKPSQPTDLPTFLKQYDLGEIDSPGLMLLYRKPTRQHVTTSITLEEAALLLADIGKIAARFAPPKPEGEPEIFYSVFRNQRLDRIQKQRCEFAFALSPQAKIVGEIIGSKTTCRIVSPVTERTNYHFTGAMTQEFDCVTDATGALDCGKAISLIPAPEQQSTIQTVFRRLAKSDSKQYQSLSVEESLANKPLFVYGIQGTSSVRLCRGIALLYNLRVKESSGKTMLTRHLPRTVANQEAAKQEIVRILPAPLFRLFSDTPNDPGFFTETDGNVALNDTAGRHSKTFPPPIKISLREPTRKEAAKALVGLLDGSLKANKEQKGFALLSDSPAVYNRLVANWILADVLPEIASYIRPAVEITAGTTTR